MEHYEILVETETQCIWVDVVYKSSDKIRFNMNVCWHKNILHLYKYIQIDRPYTTIKQSIWLVFLDRSTGVLVDLYKSSDTIIPYSKLKVIH